MVKYISLLLFIGLAWGQDSYPYFSDMSKQLEFERRKIVINEGENIEQYMSGGGSVFNWWSLVFETEPAYLNAPIQTNYIYKRFFDIVHDGKKIHEIELLRLIGLESEAERVINEYKKQIDNYENVPENVNFDKSQWESDRVKRISCTLLSGIAWGIWAARPPNEEDQITFVLSGGLVVGLFISYITMNKDDYQIVSKAEQKPILQVFTSEQSKSLAEAYNRKIYKEILDK